MKKRLNMGCGKNYLEGWVNLDFSLKVKTDVLHDLNHFPYPFRDSTFAEILCKDTLEHLDDVVKVMEEIHRIACSGAGVTILVPHYSCANAFTDPTHKRFFGVTSMNYFTGQNDWDFYTSCRFKILEAKIIFYGRYKNYLWQKIANRFPRFYEEHLAWIFPAWYLSFRLEVVKP